MSIKIHSSLNPSQIGELLRMWTSNSIYRSTPRERNSLKQSAKSLSRILGQEIPSKAYRLFETDVSEVKSWQSFYKTLDKEFPESYSTTLSGMKKFLREASGGHHHVQVSGFLFFEIKVDPEDFMFNLRSLSELLPYSELNKKDDAGFSIKEYFGQYEVVLRPGTLKKKLSSDQANLIGYSPPKRKEVWLNTPKKIKINPL